MLSFSDCSNMAEMFACSLNIHGLQNNLGYLEQNSGFKNITKSSPCYDEIFHNVGPLRKKKHIISYSVASSAQNHNIKMAGEASGKLE
jgi:hypothetical protein